MPPNPKDKLDKLLVALAKYTEGALSETERKEKERRETEAKLKPVPPKR